MKDRNNNDGPTVMELKDTDKYVRDIHSKALLPTSRNEADEYEAKRAALLAQRNRVEKMEERISGLESKMDIIINLLTAADKK
jgi:BMFP domain-containing protein YqiC